MMIFFLPNSKIYSFSSHFNAILIKMKEEQKLCFYILVFYAVSKENLMFAMTLPMTIYWYGAHQNMHKQWLFLVGFLFATEDIF